MWPTVVSNRPIFSRQHRPVVGQRPFLELDRVGPDRPRPLGPDGDDPEDVLGLVRREGQRMACPGILEPLRRGVPAERDLLTGDVAPAPFVRRDRRNRDRRIRIRHVGLEINREGIGFALLHRYAHAGAQLDALGAFRRIALHRERHLQARRPVDLRAVVKGGIRQPVHEPAADRIAMVGAKLEAAVRQHVPRGRGGRARTPRPRTAARPGRATVSAVQGRSTWSSLLDGMGPTLFPPRGETKAQCAVRHRRPAALVTPQATFPAFSIARR